MISVTIEIQLSKGIAFGSFAATGKNLCGSGISAAIVAAEMPLPHTITASLYKDPLRLISQ